MKLTLFSAYFLLFRVGVISTVVCTDISRTTMLCSVCAVLSAILAGGGLALPSAVTTAEGSAKMAK